MTARAGPAADGSGLSAASDFLICAAIGSGNTALAAERGGADLLLAINAGRLRNMGAPSIACMLPIFDADRLTASFAREELLAQCETPVLLGVCVWGQSLDPASLARSIQQAGFAGAVNFPSCMHYSRPMRQILSRAGRGIEREVEQLRAVQDVGLTSMFYCATRTQARLAADAGLDLICLNLGWNVGGALGHQSRATLEEVATTAREIGRLIKRINPRTRFFLEGGPIATAEDLGRVVNLAPIDGYVGGSTIERMPLEASVADQIDRFRQASRRSSTLDDESAGLVSWARRFGLVGRSKAQLDFLRRLRALTATTQPVLVLAEKGIVSQPIITALASSKGLDASRVVAQIDIAEEDYPGRSVSLLFGSREGGGRQPPALSDPACEVLAIHAPEQLPAAAQRRLARALRDGSFRAPGSRRSLPLRPRVFLISTLSTVAGRIEEDLTAAGMETDLIAHCIGWSLRVPPLRERIEDLAALMDALAADGSGSIPDRGHFSFEALQRLQAHVWPGNDEELRALLGSLAGCVGAAPVQPDDLLPLLRRDQAARAGVRSEKDRIVDALWRHGFSRTRTAEALGISRKTLYNKIRKYRLSG